MNFGISLTHKDSIIVDNLIRRCLGSEMYAYSHEGLCELYAYAKIKISLLLITGKIEYGSNLCGEIEWNSIPKEIDDIKAQLRIIREKQGDRE